MATKGGRTDFMFLVPSLPLPLMAILFDYFHRALGDDPIALFGPLLLTLTLTESDKLKTRTLSGFRSL